MYDRERWNPSKELINRAEIVVQEINAFLTRGRFHEAHVLSNEHSETIGNGLGVKYLEEIWETIRVSGRRLASEVERLIEQEELKRANDMMGNSSFLYHDASRLLHVYNWPSAHFQ